MALAVVVGAVVVDVYLHRLNADERRLLAEAPSAAIAAGCGQVEVTKAYPNGRDRTHVERIPALATYPTIPPASGPHAPSPLDAGVYASAPDLGEAIHSLEHAAVIIWYDPATASGTELDRVKAFFARGDERNHVVVAPYSYPGQGVAGRLPSGREMALVAWHRRELCARVSLPVAFRFVHDYRFNLWQQGAYRGDAPERYAPI